MSVVKFRTTVSDLVATGDFVVETTCWIFDDTIVRSCATVFDATTQPIFKRMVDRWGVDPDRGPRWLAEHIIAVQRQLAYETAFARL